MEIRIIAILSLIALLMLEGCSDQPSEAEAREYIQVQIRNLMQQRYHGQSFVMESFKRIDGSASTIVGVPFYRMSVEYSIRFPAGFDPGQPDMFGTYLIVLAACDQYIPGVLKAGASIHCKGDITFNRTASAWQIQ